MKTDNSELNMQNIQDTELPIQFRDAKRNHGGQTVPADFFAQFEQKMNAVIDAEQLVREAQGPVLVPQTQPAAVVRPKRWLAIAASVVVVVAIGLGWQLLQPQPGTDSQGMTELSQVTREGLLQQLENIELPEQVADEVLASGSDFEIYDMYCDL